MWARELDLYGNAIAGDSSFIPFLYQGQYYDEVRGIMFYMRVTMQDSIINWEMKNTKHNQD